MLAEAYFLLFTPPPLLYHVPQFPTIRDLRTKCFSSYYTEVCKFDPRELVWNIGEQIKLDQTTMWQPAEVNEVVEGPLQLGEVLDCIDHESRVSHVAKIRLPGCNMIIRVQRQLVSFEDDVAHVAHAPAPVTRSRAILWKLVPLNTEDKPSK
ncbi:uncharacterized protein JN550_007957 [Neoarthrinium moseri]|uniref:uncharacterized protein n=1 Tax=Neoarthrinium moseri TaxID=1658444 RepID=UPI001FDE3CE3|nr:uncharacterized protein JN550_007957 [Neoarthrinium moseri]KAI1865979.1 hypothetical protein JN550_007957 [Neoarthrinium moseri]